MLKRALLLVATVAAVALGAPASADEPQCPPGQVPQIVPGGAYICISAQDPGTPGDPGDDGGQGGHQGCFKDDGTEVPCVTDEGVWFSAYDCYGTPYEIPADDPGWAGHEGEAPYSCHVCTGGTCTTYVIWIPANDGATPADPGQLAQTSVGSLGLKTAVVHTAPQAPLVGVVGVETWLWVPSSQWAVLTRSVTAGATTVAVTATPTRVTWTLGTQTKVCNDAGTPWEATMTDSASTECGFTFNRSSTKQPDDEYKISASIGYDVDWTCTGACTAPSGSLGVVDAPAGGGALRVVERQTVVVTG